MKGLSIDESRRATSRVNEQGLGMSERSHGPFANHQTLELSFLRLGAVLHLFRRGLQRKLSRRHLWILRFTKWWERIELGSMETLTFQVRSMFFLPKCFGLGMEHHFR